MRLFSVVWLSMGDVEKDYGTFSSLEIGCGFEERENYMEPLFLGCHFCLFGRRVMQDVPLCRMWWKARDFGWPLRFVF